MNTYLYNDITIGQEEKFDVVISDKFMHDFLKITGDMNPLHNDLAYAREKGYSSRVVFGMLTASFLSTLAGVYLPGKNSLIHEVDIKFTKPVYVGDRLSVVGVVEEKNDTFQFFSMKVAIVNQKGEKVLRGKMKVGVVNEKE